MFEVKVHDSICQGWDRLIRRNGSCLISGTPPSWRWVSAFFYHHSNTPTTKISFIWAVSYSPTMGIRFRDEERENERFEKERENIVGGCWKRETERGKWRKSKRRYRLQRKGATKTGCRKNRKIGIEKKDLHIWIMRQKEFGPSGGRWGRLKKISDTWRRNRMWKMVEKLCKQIFRNGLENFGFQLEITIEFLFFDKTLRNAWLFHKNHFLNFYFQEFYYYFLYEFLFFELSNKLYFYEFF